MITALLIAAALAAEPLSASEAARHVGEVVTLRGVVAEVHHFHRGGVAIDLDAKYPHEAFTLYIPAGEAAQFGNLDQWIGRTITARGPVKLYRGSRPEIKIHLRGAEDFDGY